MKLQQNILNREYTVYLPIAFENHTNILVLEFGLEKIFIDSFK